ncbi:hypothetical protein BZB76_0162 [Actinomadura pelletieri DSM 43383]|uniref:pPIWI-RE three-gene island domain-containing protein n=1 Tax=Actinomadura pelletieri DSM 43383 TaxID=1120940 RepID=A0A495QXA0_9ACTN|nr:hypothetical protein [Actinomadura pelletieri]RKS78733.1 hypothetical protein BZB76_0162 [Actinomadura pelletieri DSM 43383]
MRDRDAWHQPVSRELNRVWASDDVRPPLLCRVELALYLMEMVAPDEPAKSAYALWSGYRLVHTREPLTERQEIAIRCARHLLWTTRQRRTWLEELDVYRRLPDRLRAYDVPSEGPARRVRPTVAVDRFAVYATALSAEPSYQRKRLPLAEPGAASFFERRRRTGVLLPDYPRPDPAVGHDLAAGRKGDGSPRTVTRDELLATARWMDRKEREEEAARPGDWAARMDSVRFAVRDTGGRRFVETDSFVFDGLTNLAGMVGAGKSTFMKVAAVWAARLPEPLRTTLVVGDVAEQLRLVELFRTLDIPAAPILGSSTRENHAQRLHRRLAAQGGRTLLDHHDEPGFDLLSTVCVIDALRGTEAFRPLRYADAPCTSLYQSRDDDALGQRRGCPLWSACPRHGAARDLVDALVWIANPASLVLSEVPRHLNEERLRHAELACSMSDLVFVDEADAVQMNFDQVFAPSATLVLPGPDSWLDQLQAHKIEELSRQGRLPLADREVEQWNAALSVVGGATDRLYKILISDEDLREWVDIDYFSPWTLQDKLLNDWLRDRAEPDDESPPDERDLFAAYEDDEDEDDGAGQARLALLDGLRRPLTEIFEAFRDDPLGGGEEPRDSRVVALVDLTADLLHTLSPARTRAGTRTLLVDLLDGTPAPVDDERWMESNCRRLEFMALLSVLSQRLNRLTYFWPQVEAALNLDATGNDLARRPPQDYAPIVPEAPMGNVLGYQYLPDDRERDADGRQSGTLRFFRHAGVGRELLLTLDRLGAAVADGRKGPHVVLMSGTSWAGRSTRAHVAAPVRAVLMPPDKAMEAVRRTTFATRFFYHDDGGRRRPMTLSGVAPDDRPAAARAMARRLGRRGRDGSESPLEQELRMVEDPMRRRAILLVGSYREAVIVAETLRESDRWYDRVRVLAADDADLGLVRRAAGDGTPVTALRRGDLATFAEDPYAEVLVAPLMAVERGHNILNAERNAAFGVAMFLARPHPRPDDLTLAVHAINDWVVRFTRDLPRDDDRNGPATFTELVTKAVDLDAAFQDFRNEARREWRRLLSRRYVYSRLSRWEKRSFAWDQLVTIWQVIGRLVRGGVPARVVFVDARFAMGAARALTPGEQATRIPEVSDPDGLLSGLHEVLAPYFTAGTDPALFDDPADPALVDLLYRPLYEALNTLTHRT